VAEFSYPSGWTDIANQALKALGSKLINNMSDGTPNASFCSQFMGAAVDTILSEEDWGAVTSRASLNQLAETPAFGPAYYYQMPNDYVRLISIDTGEEAFTVEGDRIATDAQTVDLVYVARPADPAKLTPYLRTAIAAQLALLLSIPLSSSEGTAARIQGQYMAAISLARRAEGRQKDDPSVADALAFTWWDETR
jgi:hypothetical protein